jgi:porphobilinogen deaminase
MDPGRKIQYLDQTALVATVNLKRRIMQGELRTDIDIKDIRYGNKAIGLHANEHGS